ncbi:MAG: hypothetical protein LUG98_01500 [Tannerellaceae bacterium]|nr:hypothetical protein [Tannerellaceae bacterium]
MARTVLRFIRVIRSPTVADARKLDVQGGDRVMVYNANGTLFVRANPSAMMQAGHVCLFHGYSEANATDILCKDICDPYSGFPGYRAAICNIRKAEVQNRHENDI